MPSAAETVLCQFAETIPGKLYTCPVCGYEAKTNALPRMVCGSVANKPKPTGKPRQKRSAKTPQRDSEARERQLQEAVGQCAHRGGIIAAKKTCELCGAKGELYDLYACEIHGECSLGSRVRGLTKCLGCEDVSR